MKNIIAIALSVAVLSGCGVNPQSATNAAEAQGLTDFKVTGYSFFGCGNEDMFKSSFTAIGANGKPISGVVCSGMFKGVTFRFN